MLLSVCLIARNEEINLPRALGSVSKVADEIIVTDTGSRDGTKTIASNFGACVSDFPWCDDFSAARNFAVDQARGKWIFWLDADEELLGSSAVELRDCLSREDALAFFVLRQDLARPDHLDYFTQMWQLRLFRNRPDFRFRGRCHPDFHPSLQEIAEKEGRTIPPSAITLRHYGYLGSLRQEKLLRAARLLELELADRPGQLYYLIEYGRTLLSLNDPRASIILTEAVEKILPFLNDSHAPIPLVALLFEYLLQLPDNLLPHALSPSQVRDLAQRWFPTAPPLLWLRAQQAFNCGRYPEAETLLRALLKMGRDQSYDKYVSFDPRIIGEDALLNLAVALVRQTKLDEAERYFSRLLRNPTRGEEARKNLRVIKQLRRQFRK